MRASASLLLLFCTVLAPALLHARQPELDEVLVTGEQPGPGLWRATAFASLHRSPGLVHTKIHQT